MIDPFRLERLRAVRTVEDLIKDLSDRGGLSHEWAGIDKDVRDEIKRTWREIILHGMGVYDTLGG